ncbi:MAG: cell division protein [Robiginitomaculum sp.]|nr:MAG: cell division protein [Robiginitomaculum sp.]
MSAMVHALKKIRFSWSVAVLAVFYLYLGFHALSGNQGILKWADYAEKINALESEIAVLQKDRKSLELHANQLRATHLDLDRLDEEARRSLNVSRANEIVIWLDDTP